MEASYNGVGGIKEVVAMVSGQSVYSKLKYESGAHRVQRVPVTESQGRVHTSTATVLVMPEVEEVEYDIDPKDLRIDIYHASGAGGQNVNKVATAVRIVHLPTNIKVEMQEERTQQKNRDKAMEAESLSFVYRSLKNLSFTDFIFAIQQEITPEEKEFVESIYKQLVAHVPAQYIIGHAEFYGIELKVDERVLIPRPETEELVELILTENAKPNQSVLDIGTGSGAIALALAKNRPDWLVTASDISPDALNLASENASLQDLKISFKKSDCFAEIAENYDIIVSNPPYISRADEAEVGLNVLHSEPHLALFAEEDGLAIYRKIAQEAKNHLREGGKIYLEIGYKQGHSVPALFRKYLPEKRVRTLKDQFGQDRMVVVDDG